MDKKIVWSSGVSALIAAILILGGGELTDTVDIGKEKLYGCEAREIVMPCDSLSKYYSLSNGKCWNADVGNKLCRSGWTQDFKVIDESVSLKSKAWKSLKISVEVFEDQINSEPLIIEISGLSQSFLINFNYKP